MSERGEMSGDSPRNCVSHAAAAAAAGRGSPATALDEPYTKAGRIDRLRPGRAAALTSALARRPVRPSVRPSSARASYRVELHDGVTDAVRGSPTLESTVNRLASGWGGGLSPQTFDHGQYSALMPFKLREIR